MKGTSINSNTFTQGKHKTARIQSIQCGCKDGNTERRQLLGAALTSVAAAPVLPSIAFGGYDRTTDNLRKFINTYDMPSSAVEEGKFDIPAQFKLKQCENLCYRFELPTMFSTGIPVDYKTKHGPSNYQSGMEVNDSGRQRTVLLLENYLIPMKVQVKVGTPWVEMLGDDWQDNFKPKEAAYIHLMDQYSIRLGRGQSKYVYELRRVENIKRQDGTRQIIYEHVEPRYTNIADKESRANEKTLISSVLTRMINDKPWLYTLTVSVPSSEYQFLKPDIRHCIDSFTLTDLGEGFTDPNKNSVMGFIL